MGDADPVEAKLHLKINDDDTRDILLCFKAKKEPRGPGPKERPRHSVGRAN